MLYSTIGDHEFIAKVGVSSSYKPGQKIKLAFDTSKAQFFDKDTEFVIK